MNAFERLGRFLVADVVAVLAFLAAVMLVGALAPSVPVVGALLLEYLTGLGVAAAVIAWAWVMHL